MQRLCPSQNLIAVKEQYEARCGNGYGLEHWLGLNLIITWQSALAIDVGGGPMTHANVPPGGDAVDYKTKSHPRSRTWYFHGTDLNWWKRSKLPDLFLWRDEMRLPDGPKGWIYKKA